jgi:hypothetical protein
MKGIYYFCWMKLSTASATLHAVSHKIKAAFLKTAQKPLPSQFFASQGHADIGAGKSGYSLQEMCITLNSGTQLTFGSVSVPGIVFVS